MKVRIHLISAPWARPTTPSIQIGALKSHVDRLNIDNVHVINYSAFLELPLRFLGPKKFSLWSSYAELGEYPYSLALLKKYFPNELKKSGKSLDQILLNFNKNYPLYNKVALKKKLINDIIQATTQYVDDHFGFDVGNDEIHIFGFTLNYLQVASSAFMAKAIFEKMRGKNVIFLFGGMSAAVPTDIDLIKMIEAPSYGVLGEGEVKIGKLAKLASEANNFVEFKKQVTEIKGIYSFDQVPDLWIKEKSMYEGQYSDISTLPIPDYSEHFELIKSITYDFESEAEFLAHTEIPVEGSRGCFAKCSFCGLNYIWMGFRKMTHNQVLQRVIDSVGKYNVNKIQFVDNVCDTWAEGYADECIRLGVAPPSFMELRSHHPEQFWTKLALAGVKEIQVGIEALSVGVLKIIGKGTTVAQNLLATKYFSELGIWSGANLIIRYPGSKIEHVKETRDILEKIAHFQIFSIVSFRMVLGSPLYDSLSDQQKRNLQPNHVVKFPENLKKFQLGFGFETPEGLIETEVDKAWIELGRWYEKFSLKGAKSTLSCEVLVSGKIKITVHRFGRKPNIVYLEAMDAQVFQICHQGPTLERIIRETNISEEQLMQLLKKFEDQGFVYNADGKYINLCIRNRDELINNFIRHKNGTQKSQGIVVDEEANTDMKQSAS